MWISQVEIENVKGFRGSNKIDFGKRINILVGPNNSGKSAVINSLYSAQNSNALTWEDVSTGVNQGKVVITFEDINSELYFKKNSDFFAPLGTFIPKFEINSKPRGNEWEIRFMTSQPNNYGRANRIDQVEPHNLIYPFLSKRKVSDLEQAVHSGVAYAVHPNLANIVAKIDDIKDEGNPNHGVFRDACMDILGFPISTFPSETGKRAGWRTNIPDRHISLEKMGEGVLSLLGLIIPLCKAEGKVFLIEELENDLHPRALKKLLELIILKSQTNQFIISTHSNIVLRMLGSLDSTKIIKIDLIYENLIPVTNYRYVQNTVEERRQLMSELGYELSDMDLWSQWIFFEESSAEQVFREYFIKWYANNLVGKLRTIGGKGIGTVKSRFSDIYNLLLYTHLESAMSGRAFAILDNHEQSVNIKENLLSQFRTIDPNDITILSKSKFEDYYPPRFQEDIDSIDALRGSERQEAKTNLLRKVLKWISENEEQAKDEFRESASEFVEILNRIEQKYSGNIATH